MKKIILAALAVLMMLCFVGCGEHTLKTVSPVKYVMGDITKGSVQEMTVTGDTSTFKFTYDSSMTAWGGGNGTVNFKVAAKADTNGLDWANAYSNGEFKLNDEAIYVYELNTSNITCKGLGEGIEYTLTVTADVGGVNVTITGEEPKPAADADLSAINATTMAQAGAYISINGDAWGDATVGKYFFNKKGDNYVAVIPFDIPNDASNSWGKDHYQAWGKIGVGDNKTVKAAENQYKFADGKLTFTDGDNIDFNEIVAGSKGVITVTATADGCTCVATVY